MAAVGKMHFSCVCVWAQIAPTHEARTLARLTMPVGACVLTPVAMRCASPRRASAWRLCILRARTPWRAQQTVRRCGASRARRCDVFYMVECCAGGCSRPCRLPSPTVRRTHAALPRRPARSPSGLCARHTYSLPHHAPGTACQPLKMASAAELRRGAHVHVHVHVHVRVPVVDPKALTLSAPGTYFWRAAVPIIRHAIQAPLEASLDDSGR